MSIEYVDDDSNKTPTVDICVLFSWPAHVKLALQCLHGFVVALRG